MSSRWIGAAVAVPLGLAALAGGLWLASAPPERLDDPSRLTLSPDRFTHDLGIAYLAPLPRAARGLRSEREGFRTLRLFEDGEELSGGALHATVRTEEGRFSHWGDQLWLSLKDGSDPRETRPVLELLVPSRRPLWASALSALLGVGGAAVSVMGLHRALGSSRRRTAVTLALVSLAVLIGLFSGSRLSPRLKALERLDEAVSTPPRPSASLPPAEPRTLRLGHESSVGFDARGSVPDEEAPAPLGLISSSGPGHELLVGPGRHAYNPTPLSIAAVDLARVELALRVRKAGRIAVHLSERTMSESFGWGVGIELEVEPSEDVQRFTVVRPAIGGEGLQTVRYVTVRAAPSSEPEAEVVSVSLSNRLDAFSGRTHGSESLQLGASLRPTMWQTVAGTHRIRIPAGPARSLRFAVGRIRERTEAGDAAARYAIELDQEDGRILPLVEGTSTGFDRWDAGQVQVPELAADAVLHLRVPELRDGTLFAWANLRLTDESRPPRRVVVILIDTLRADALGCYGHPGDPTPNIDALARDGGRFALAFSQGPWTRPSVPTLMTGLYVPATGVQEIGDRLPPTYDTMAEHFARAGYFTASIVTNAHAGPASGLDQGFDRVELHIQPGKIPTAELLEQVVRPTLEASGSDDLFLYLHLMEVHGPYGPERAAPELLTGVIAEHPLPRAPEYDWPWIESPSAEGRRALYASSVRSLDAALGTLLEHLDHLAESEGGARPTVVVASDHGEFLGEDRVWGHPHGELRPETIHVPLLLRAPGIAAGTVWPDPVENIDVLPTLLELTGLAPPELVRRDAALPVGRSLAAHLVGEAPREPGAYAIATDGGYGRYDRALSVFGSEVSFSAVRPVEAAQVDFFDDPLHRRGTATSLVPDPAAHRTALRLWEHFLLGQSELREGLWVEATHEDEIDVATQAQLKALGYID